jgi:chemotaxis protein methyltransferase CheR
MAEALELSDQDLQAIAQFVYARSGIALHDGKRALVTARLQKHVRAGGFRTFGEYLRFVEDDESGDELVQLLDAIATNHTAFFREAQHFDFLVRVALPDLMTSGRGTRLHAWSAGCATGEEAYSLAMTLIDTVPSEWLPAIRIFASDLSATALQHARGGVYRMDRLALLPHDVIRRHFEKGLGSQTGLARVNARAQQLVTFARLNLVDANDLGQRFAVIFCRNVMIYFDRAMQQRVAAVLERHLLPGGYLFLSHAETLNGVTHSLHQVAPAVYQRCGR